MNKSTSLSIMLLCLMLVAALAVPAIAQGDPPAGRISIGDYSLYIECMGNAVNGSPTVIMEHRLGGLGRSWLPVQPDIAAFTRVCVYDRAGMGGSDAGPEPRNGYTQVRELHALLGAAGLQGPYVFVGIEWGGLLARLYDVYYPDEVAGMVLVDAIHEDQDVRFAELSMGDEAQHDREVWSQPEKITIQDRDDTFELMRTARQQAPSDRAMLGDMPLVVLSHGEFAPLFNQTPEQAMERYLVWQEVQEDLASLSTNSMLVVAEHTARDQYIQNEQPELVVEATRAVVEAAQMHFPVLFDPPDQNTGDELAPTPTPELVADPTFPVNTVLIIPDSGFVYQLAMEPGSLMPAAACNIGSEVVVEMTVLAADGQHWLLLDCNGMIGWGLEADFMQ